MHWRLCGVPLAIRLGHRFQLLDRPGKHKRHKHPVPFLGGLSLFLILWITLGVTLLVFPKIFAFQGESLPFILLGAVMILIVGFIDDVRPLSAWTKLLVEIAIGFLLYVGGVQIDPISVPFVGEVSAGGWSVLITIGWVVGLTNAVNIIDGLDGLAAGVSLIAALTLSGVGLLYGNSPVLAVTGAMIGFLAVFLRYNRYPARIFLGDSGALQIGYYFAVISLLMRLKSYTAAALYLPLIAAGVPLMEAVIAFSRRLVTGKNVMRADRRHLFHYLTLAGLSPSRVVYIFYLLSVVFGLFTLAMFFWNRVLVSGLLILFMVVISVAFFIFMAGVSRSRRPESSDPDTTNV